MKTIILIVLLAVYCHGEIKAVKRPEGLKAQAPKAEIIQRFPLEFDYGCSVVRINGCQYIVYVGYRSGGICHAGNCDNPIHEKYEVVLPRPGKDARMTQDNVIKETEWLTR